MIIVSRVLQKALREGEILAIWKLDRMDRSLNHPVKTTALQSERGRFNDLWRLSVFGTKWAVIRQAGILA